MKYLAFLLILLLASTKAAHLVLGRKDHDCSSSSSSSSGRCHDRCLRASCQPSHCSCKPKLLDILVQITKVLQDVGGLQSSLDVLETRIDTLEQRSTFITGVQTEDWVWLHELSPQVDGEGIGTDIDISGYGFECRPMIFTSLTGDTTIYQVSGANSIHFVPGNEFAFRIILTRINSYGGFDLTPDWANGFGEGNYKINYLLIAQPCNPTP